MSALSKRLRASIMPSTAVYSCRCGNNFEARTADRKRGWARFCSKSCKAIEQSSKQQKFPFYKQNGSKVEPAKISNTTKRMRSELEQCTGFMFLKRAAVGYVCWMCGKDTLHHSSDGPLELCLECDTPKKKKKNKNQRAAVVDWCEQPISDYTIVTMVDGRR